MRRRWECKPLEETEAGRALRYEVGPKRWCSNEKLMLGPDDDWLHSRGSDGFIKQGEKTHHSALGYTPFKETSFPQATMSLRKNIHSYQQHLVDALFFGINKVEAMKQENKNLWDVECITFQNCGEICLQQGKPGSFTNSPDNKTLQCSFYILRIRRM